MMHALLLKAHLLFALLSITGFVLRGGLTFAGVRWRQWRWLRVLPHLNDTLLLVAGIWLAWNLGFLRHGLPDWLLAKIVALAVYIALGLVALRHGGTKKIRALAWLAALGVFAYILAVARMRTVNPLPLLF